MLNDESKKYVYDYVFDLKGFGSYVPSKGSVGKITGKGTLKKKIAPPPPPPPPPSDYDIETDDQNDIETDDQNDIETDDQKDVCGEKKNKIIYGYGTSSEIGKKSDDDSYVECEKRCVKNKDCKYFTWWDDNGGVTEGCHIFKDDNNKKIDDKYIDILSSDCTRIRIKEKQLLANRKKAGQFWCGERYPHDTYNSNPGVPRNPDWESPEKYVWHDTYAGMVDSQDRYVTKRHIQTGKPGPNSSKKKDQNNFDDENEIRPYGPYYPSCKPGGCKGGYERWEKAPSSVWGIAYGKGIHPKGPNESYCVPINSNNNCEIWPIVNQAAINNNAAHIRGARYSMQRTGKSLTNYHTRCKDSLSEVNGKFIHTTPECKGCCNHPNCYNKCICPGGTPVKGNKCPTDNSHNCVSCSIGYILKSGKCVGSGKPFILKAVANWGKTMYLSWSGGQRSLSGAGEDKGKYAIWDPRESQASILRLTKDNVLYTQIYNKVSYLNMYYDEVVGGKSGWGRFSTRYPLSGWSSSWEGDGPLIFPVWERSYKGGTTTFTGKKMKFTQNGETYDIESVYPYRYHDGRRAGSAYSLLQGDGRIYGELKKGSSSSSSSSRIIITVVPI